MKKYYLLYCTVLYCSIGVFGCDCCRKLCVKSGEEGVPEEKGKGLEKDPNTGEEDIPYEVKKKWPFLAYYTGTQAEKWARALTTAKLEDVDAVPVLFYASCDDVNAFWEYEMPNEHIASGNVFAFNKNSTFDDILKYLQTNDKITNIVLSCEGGNEKILYDGSQKEVGNMKIVDVFTAFKNAKDPFLKRVVCLSFTYDLVKKDG